ncbi:UDP-glucosyltransferase 2-like [Epargyreus clarus]|uniref:UDP-glucosyltransferase 2-like n=1 Tax=Epargyreus clarus TaxID=520877 RepID=UPI003C2D0B3E
MTGLVWIPFFCFLSQTSDAYKALVIFPLPSKSHTILGDNLVKLIAEAGNEVTYLTTFPRDKPPPRVKEVDISDNKRLLPDDLMNIKAVMNKEVSLSNITNFITILNELSSMTLQNPGVQKLLNDPNEKFDVIIAEWMYNDVYSGLTPIFDCPIIWLSTVEPHWKIMRIIDEIPSPAYNADAISNNQLPFSFKQRVQELGYQISGLLLQYFFTSKRENAQYESIIAPIIRKRGKAVPDFEELRFNASLVLGNSHVSLGRATRLPQNYKPIAGYHIPKEVAPLTGDLKNLLDNAKNGLIYFSLGSNLKSKYLPDDLKKSLLKMFGELKQTVLWKFEEDLPNRPSNVHIIQWAPQPSILAHKNCILFITHGGILSTIEAVYYGKPVVGIPVFGDQFSNVDRAVDKGFAKKVELTYTMANELKIAIQEIVSDPSYAAKAKELSLIYHDRPVSPAVELVHWVQHVIRTSGAVHLRSPALQVPWYQKMYLDLALVIVSLILGLKMLLKWICSKLCGKSRSKVKKS